jgi:hypothetical protein
LVGGARKHETSFKNDAEPDKDEEKYQGKKVLKQATNTKSKMSLKAKSKRTAKKQIDERRKARD